MSTEKFIDENADDIEKNNGGDDGLTTFSLDDDDECVIEDVDDDSDDDSVEHRQTIHKMFRNAEDKANDNYNIHDQLPSVEEVKASDAYLPTARLLAKGHRRKLMLTIAAAAFAAIILSVSISIGVFRSENKRQKQDQPNKNNQNKNHPNKNIQNDPLEVEMLNNVENRFEETVDLIFQHHVSTLPNLRQPKSPEYRAAQFIAGGDAYNATMGEFFSHESRKFIERYVLALFYYQTDGENWDDSHNFLAPIDHCQWHNKYVTPQGAFIKGVQCSEEGFVIDIDLGK